MLKRGFDIVAAVVGLLVLWPFIALAMLAVRLNSPGPAIFGQFRVGRNGVHFRCHKLRTMFVGVAHVPTHEAAPSGVTSVGRFLRRSKLDELPQLYDVLVGAMSFVGPRPCLITQTELVRMRMERGVLAARPGITGLAQIRGVDMSDPFRLAEIDAEYVQSRTFLFDMKILFSTVFSSAGFGDRIRP